MHRGWVHPSFEDHAFRRWLKWHNSLERTEERRRIERTFNYLRYSKHMAEIHVEVVALKRLILICSEVSSTAPLLPVTQCFDVVFVGKGVIRAFRRS